MNDDPVQVAAQAAEDVLVQFWTSEGVCSPLGLLTQVEAVCKALMDWRTYGVANVVFEKRRAEYDIARYTNAQERLTYQGIPQDAFCSAAAETLKIRKKQLGCTWDGIAEIFGNLSSSGAIRGYVSAPRFMPLWFASLVHELDCVMWTLANDPPSGDAAIVLSRGTLMRIELPSRTRNCSWCGKVFVPGHPQQMYCTGYSGQCGLAMRRLRYKERNG
jgi:hypothetical protein